MFLMKLSRQIFAQGYQKFKYENIQFDVSLKTWFIVLEVDNG